MHNTTNAAFIDDVLKPSYAGTVVVMFHASWCGPCKAMKPQIEKLAEEQGFTLVGVDAGTERTLASQEGVRGVPALIVYKDGKAEASRAGGAAPEQLRMWLAAAGV